MHCARYGSSHPGQGASNDTQDGAGNTFLEDAVVDDWDVYIVLLQQVEEPPRCMHSTDAVCCAQESHHCL